MSETELFVLGISYGYHDSAVALVRNGEVIFASSEERFSRIKNDKSFPRLALRYAQKTYGVTDENVSAVVYYERPEVKLRRIYNTCQLNDDVNRFAKVLGSWLSDGRIDVAATIAAHSGISASKVQFSHHHLSHASAAFFCSPFDSAAVLTIDGVGESQTQTIYDAFDNELTLVSESQFPNSVGLLYAAFTQFLGFASNEDEYKVMGLAAYGEPSFADQVRKLVTVDHSGSISVNSRYLNFSSVDVAWTQAFLDVFGNPLDSSWRFEHYSEQDFSSNTNLRRAACLAKSLQTVTEEVVCDLAEIALRKTGRKNLCLSGGVALNGLANDQLLRRTAGRDIGVFVYPSPGDSGSAVGAALWWCHRPDTQSSSGAPFESRTLTDRLSRARWGTKATASEQIYLGFDVEEDHDSSPLRQSVYFLRKIGHQALIDEAAERLSQGEVCGWVQGRAEWGPRALGNRSILASPARGDVKDRVNAKIKYRELYRPFAPVVLEEFADRVFEINGKRLPPRWSPHSYMLSVVKVREQWIPLIPGVVHFDSTARIQIVNRHQNGILFDLLTRFHELTGLPVLLNTSFNLNGEPIVNNARDALRTFERSDIDALFVGNLLLAKGRP